MTWIDYLLGGSDLAKRVDALETAVHTVTQEEDRLMGLIDDLRAQMQQMSASVSTVETEISAVTTEVNDLIARIQPGATVAQADVDQLTALGTRLQAAADALKAIPAEPTA